MNICSLPCGSIEAVLSSLICKGRGFQGSQADVYFYTPLANVLILCSLLLVKDLYLHAYTL